MYQSCFHARRGNARNGALRRVVPIPNQPQRGEISVPGGSSSGAGNLAPLGLNAHSRSFPQGWRPGLSNLGPLGLTLNVVLSLSLHALRGIEFASSLNY